MHTTMAAPIPDLTLWEPIIIAIGAAIVGLLTWLIRTISRLDTQIAVIIEHNRASDNADIGFSKMHDEVIDLKLASSELDQISKDHTRQLGQIWDTIKAHHPIG